MNTIYYGQVLVNNAGQTRATTIYAPTGAGTAGQYLKSSGGTSAPVWETIASTYSSTGTTAINGTGVAAALATLDSTLPSGWAASKTLTGLTITDGKMTAATFTNIAIEESQVTNLTTDLAAKAPLASPALTGTPTAPTAAANTNSTQIATTAFVMNAFAANDAMIYKGTLDGAETSQNSGAGGLTPAADRGHTYKVATAGYINGEAVEVGDMLICVTDSTAASTSSNFSTIKANWNIIQNNIDGVVFRGATAFTSGNVVIADGTAGKVKTSSYTIGKSVPSDAVFTDTKVTSSANHYTPSTASGSDKTASATGATAAWSIDVVKGITINTDGKGHITGLSVTSGKIPANPNTDTKVNMIERGTTKAYLLATSTTPTSSTQGVTALAETGVYLDTTAGKLVASSFYGPLVGNVTGNVTGNLTGTATTATNLAAAPSFSSGGSNPTAFGANTTYTLTVGGQSVVFKTPADSDSKVTQSSSTTTNWRKILLHYKDDAASTTAVTSSTNQVYAAVGVSVQPSTGTIRADKYNIFDKATLQWNANNQSVEFIFA